jgi:Tfp pilus assembly protein PilP
MAGEHVHVSRAFGSVSVSGGEFLEENLGKVSKIDDDATGGS